MPDPSHADLVSGFELGAPIGRGGFATVYRARQLSLNREVAVKVDNRILDDDRNRRRFLREATAAALISSHPHVVSLIDAGTTSDNRPYLAMELCENGSVGQLVKRQGPMPAADVVELGIAISGALAAAHEKGILHRDIKPANILIDLYGTPRLGDFGLAALPAQGELSVTLEALTPAFAAPEAFEHAVPSKQADVWALGASLYTVLTGMSPRHNNDGSPASVAEIISTLYRPLPPAPQIRGADPLLSIIWRATAPQREQRFADGAALNAALLELRGQLGRPRSILAGSEVTRMVPDKGQQVQFPVQPPNQPSGPPGKQAGVDHETRPRRAWPIVVSCVLLGAVIGGGASYLALRSARNDAQLPIPPASTSDSGPANAPAPSPSITLTDPSETGQIQVPAAPICFGGLVDIAGTVSAEEIDCAMPHFWEAYAVGSLAEDIASPSLADVSADATVIKACTPERFESYSQITADGIELAVLPPSSTAFGAGSRMFLCIASDGVSVGSFQG